MTLAVPCVICHFEDNRKEIMITRHKVAITALKTDGRGQYHIRYCAYLSSVEAEIRMLH